MAGFSLSRRDLMTGGLSIAGLSITGLTACSPRKDAKSGDLSNLTLRVATYRGNPESFFTEAGVAEPPYKLARSQFAGGNLIVESDPGNPGFEQVVLTLVAGDPALDERPQRQQHHRREGQAKNETHCRRAGRSDAGGQSGLRRIPSGLRDRGDQRGRDPDHALRTASIMAATLSGSASGVIP